MKYVKADVSWSLEEGKKAFIRTHVQTPGRSAGQINQTKVLMESGGKSNLMMLNEDVKALRPHKSRGAILTRSFNANLSPIMIGGVITLHQEIWDEYLEAGYIDEDGNVVGEESKAADPGVSGNDSASPSTEDSSGTEEPEADPADVNKDGKVDMEDVAEVVEAAKEEAGGAELSEENPEPASEATPDLAEAANDERAKCQCGKTKDEDGFCDGSHAAPDLTPEQLESWTHCMQDKIVSHYGEEVKECTDGITHGNWEKILECMVTVLGITDPEIWIPEQIILFTEWSAECIF